jgi:DNA-binding transcriptional regulator PaaX
VRRKPDERKEKTSPHHLDAESYGRGELAKEILLMIAAGVVIPAAFVMPGIPIALKPLLTLLSKKCGAKRNEGFIKSITYLKRNRLISMAEKDGQQVLILTENGKKRTLQFNLEKMTIERPRKWDGLWRIVIFDIPEKRKGGREALRSKLKQLGFYQLQKSCFIHPFDCKSEIDFISEIYEVSPYVNFIVAREVEGAALLKKSFGLS